MFFFQAEDGIRDGHVTGVQTCALPISFRHKNSTNTYPLASEPAVLAWFGQLAALELHVPQWQFTEDGAPRNPDRFVLDLDPGPGAELAQCVEVAFLCREILSDMGLETIPVTSGSKGIHLYAKLDRKSTRLNSSHVAISYAVFCLKKKKTMNNQ